MWYRINNKEQNICNICINHIRCSIAATSKSIKYHDIPALAWDNSNFITFSIWSYLPCLPPFIIRSINDMENVAKFEVQSLTWKAAIFSLVIIKKSSVLKRKKFNIEKARQTPWEYEQHKV